MQLVGARFARLALLLLGLAVGPATPAFGVTCSGPCNKPAVCDAKPKMGDTVNLSQSHSGGNCTATITVTQATQTTAIGESTSITNCAACANVDVDGTNIGFTFVCPGAMIPTLTTTGLLTLVVVLLLGGATLLWRRRRGSAT